MAEMTRQRRVLVLAICCMSLLIVGLDNTIVNVALPSIQKDLHASVSGLQWTVDAYTLVLASLLLLSGSTGDRFGRRRTFQTGLIVFSVGSLLCSLAPGLGWLVVFRMVQAVGGSMLNPVAMSIITNTFTDRRERAQAIGIWGGVVGISLALGPIVGGALVDSIGWRSIFWINVPVGLVALILTARFVPESRADHPRRVDPVGQILVLVLLAGLVYAIIEGPSRGWGSPLILGLFVLSVASLIALVWYEGRRVEPLIDPRFFKSVPFSGATIIALCGFAALAGFLLLNTLYLQNVRGYSPLDGRSERTAVRGDDGHLRADFRPDRRAPGHPPAARGRGRHDDRGRFHAHQPQQHHVHLVAAGDVHHLRSRLRHAERADHEHGRLRHADQPGRRRGRGGVDEPSGRTVARCRGHRLGGGLVDARRLQDLVRGGESRRLVGDHGLRSRGARARLLLLERASPR